MKTAVLIRVGHPVAQAMTAARSGETVHYGWETVDNGRAIHEIGTARVSRAAKYLDDAELIESLPLAFVNYGGGAPI